MEYRPSYNVVEDFDGPNYLQGRGNEVLNLLGLQCLRSLDLDLQGDEFHHGGGEGKLFGAD